jgi:esterase
MAIELNYKDYGQGEPVIIIHGLFGTLDNWQTIAKNLAEKFNIYLIDQRNHGRSPHTEAFDYTLLAEDLHDFMENNWIYKARIIGHSMGGKTAMQFALEYPDMVEKLVVIDIAPKNYIGGHEVILETLQSIDLTTIKERKEVENLMAERITDAGQRQFLMKNLSRDEKTGQYEWKMNLSSLVQNYQKIIDNIQLSSIFKGETLFVRGEKSDYVLDSDEPILKAFFPNSQLHTIPNAGHWVHADQPKLLLEVLNVFLD